VTLPNLRQAALSGARWTISGRVGLQLVTWPATILVMRLLESADYGLFAIAVLVTGFIALFAELGLGVALVQAPQVSKEMARMASTLILILNGAIALTIIVLAPWVAELLDEPDVTPVMRLLTIELLLSALATVPQAMLERDLRFRQISIAQVAGGVIGALTTVAAALLDCGVWSLVLGNLVGALVRSVLQIGYYGGVVWPGRLRLAAIHPMVHVSGHVLAGRALWYWYGQADQLVLARLLHASLLGVYSVAAQLAMLPASKVMEAVNRVAFPILSRMRSGTAELGPTHERLVSLLALYGFGVCWGLAAVSHEFVVLVLGAKWEAAAIPLAMLSLIAPLRMLCSLHNTITTAIGSPQSATRELIVAGLLVPTAVSVGAWWNGLVGASLAWPLVFPFIYLLSNHLTCAAIGRHWWSGLRPLAVPLGAGLFMLAMVWLTRRVLDDMPVAVQLGAEILVGALAYGGMLWMAARPLLLEARSLVLELVRPGRSAPSA
jgi:teichuronic acid exporter